VTPWLKQFAIPWNHEPPPKVTGDPVMVRVQPDVAKSSMRKQEYLPGRPEAIRRLVDLGLKAKKA
jgi:hypothetical protein